VQSGLRSKDASHRVGVGAESGSAEEEYALAGVVAKGTCRGSCVWTRAGYVPRAQAKELGRIWPRYRGRRLVGEGRLVGDPGKEQSPEIVIEGSFRNYFVDGQ